MRLIVQSWFGVSPLVIETEHVYQVGPITLGFFYLIQTPATFLLNLHLNLVLCYVSL